MKINTFILLLRTRMILLSSFVIYFSVYVIREVFPLHEIINEIYIMYMAHITCFHLGNLAWVIPPELFKQGPRDVAASFSAVVIWVSMLIFSVTFEFMAVSSKVLLS